MLDRPPEGQGRAPPAPATACGKADSDTSPASCWPRAARHTSERRQNRPSATMCTATTTAYSHDVRVLEVTLGAEVGGESRPSRWSSGGAPPGPLLVPPSASAVPRSSRARPRSRPWSPRAGWRMSRLAVRAMAAVHQAGAELNDLIHEVLNRHRSKCPRRLQIGSPPSASWTAVQSVPPVLRAATRLAAWYPLAGLPASVVEALARRRSAIESAARWSATRRLAVFRLWSASGTTLGRR